MAKIDILVGGTAKTFSPDVPILTSTPELASQFDPLEYNLVADGRCEFLVSFNHEKKLYRKFIKSGGNSQRSILIQMEPDSIFPGQYKKRIENKYGLIISPGSSKYSIESDSFVGWPYKYHLNPAEPDDNDPDLRLALDSNYLDDLFSLKNWRERSHKLVMIAANKVSPISTSNYGARRHLAKTAHSNLLEVYGPLWNEKIYFRARHRLAVLVGAVKQGTFPNLVHIYAALFTKYKTAKGAIPDKHEILKETKFNLVVENSNNVVTEKIFDALINGSIPVYIGPDLVEFGIPQEVALTASPDIAKIEKVINNLTEQNIESYLESIRSFVMSEYFRMNWESAEVHKKIAAQIKSYIISIK